MKSDISYLFLTTLKIQPAVILFSSVSILAKIASGLLPHRKTDETVLNYGLQIITDWRITGLIALMFCILGIYAIIWQRLIKNAKIAVIYANKSSYLLWTQLAAIFLFKEHISWSNIVGICIIFTGITLNNSGAHERA